ncbi:hypothetical protein [Lysobacter sp. P5_B9]
MDRPLGVALLSIGLATSLAGCNRFDTMRWREEVWLHDGTFIHVDRYAERRAGGFPNSRRGPITKQELSYLPLRVKWNVEGTSEQTVSFDVIKGVPYLVAILNVDKSEFCLGKSPGSYVARYFTWKNGKKVEISRNDIPLELMRKNVTGVSQWGLDRSRDRSYISWAAVRMDTGQRLDGPPMLLTEMFKQNNWLVCK